MYWDDEWECTNCGETIDSDEDDNDESSKVKP